MLTKLLLCLFICYHNFKLKFLNNNVRSHNVSLFALQQPSNKSFDQMDLFDKLDFHFREQDFQQIDNILIQIYETKNPGYTLKNGKRVKKIKHPEILRIEWQDVVNGYDNKYIFDILKGNIPRPPETEEEIQEDSFEGFLLKEFKQIAELRKAITVEEFYQWKTKMGLLLTKDEFISVYRSIIIDMSPCEIMDFIKINKIIDEGNAGDYRNFQ